MNQDSFMTLSFVWRWISIEQNLDTIPSVPLLKFKHLSTYLTVKLSFTSIYFFFSFIFPMFQTQELPQENPKTHQLLDFSTMFSFLLFLSLFPSLSLRLFELSNSALWTLSLALFSHIGWLELKWFIGMYRLYLIIGFQF